MAEMPAARLEIIQSILERCRRYDTFSNVVRYLSTKFAAPLRTFCESVKMRLGDVSEIEEAQGLLGLLERNPFYVEEGFDARGIAKQLSSLAGVAVEPFWEQLSEALADSETLKATLKVLQDELILPDDAEEARVRIEVKELEEKLQKLEEESTGLIKDIATLTEDKNGLRAANTQLKGENGELAKKAEQIGATLSQTQKKVQEVPQMRKLLEEIAAIIDPEDGA
jgi:DNA repair exonuclease SbcCD ATPase subunit